MQLDIFEPRNMESFVRYNLSQQEVARKADTYSICYRLKLVMFSKGEISHVSISSSNENANAFIVDQTGHILGMYINNLYQPIIKKATAPSTLRHWNFFCHVVDQGKYWYYQDGKLQFQGDLQGESTLHFNGIIILGQEQDRMSASFDPEQSLAGYQAQVNIWNRALDVRDVMSLNECRSNDFGNIFSTDVNDLEVFDVRVFEVPLESLCDPEFNVVVYPEEFTLNDSLSFCDRSGTSLYLPGTVEDAATLYKASEGFVEECNPGGNFFLWLAGTDEEEEGVWNHIINGKSIPEPFFSPGQPNGYNIENCLTLMRPTGLFGDSVCFQDKVHCFSCEDQLDRPLYLRGLCFRQTKYRLTDVTGYINRKPYFLTRHDYFVYWGNQNQWLLHSRHRNLTIATLKVQSDSIYPMGRYNWEINEDLCNSFPGAVREISLSACGDGEYMCNNGDCINKTQRCDFRDDCVDFSDEDNCRVIQTKPGYRKHRPPLDVHNTLGPLPLYANTTIMRISEVDDVGMTVYLEFRLQLSWVDNRLIFFNLRELTGSNKLSEKEVKEVWRPKLVFPNVKDGNIKTLSQSVLVERTGPPEPVDINDIDMDFMYSANSASLVQRQQYTGGFACFFYVVFYPFDEQSCSIVFQLEVSREMVSFLEENVTVSYNGDRQLVSFFVDQVTVEVMEQKESDDPSQGSQMRVTFRLVRKYGRILLVLFLPSCLLLLIGYSTLYVQVSMLQVRLVVTLTTLLVLYTLFNQTSSNLPNTSYIKMVDVWFFFCILLLFSIILFHVFVERLGTNKKPEIVKVTPFQTKKNPISTPVNFTRNRSEEAMHRVRVYLVPGVIVVFSLIYSVLLVWGNDFIKVT